MLNVGAADVGNATLLNKTFRMEVVFFILVNFVCFNRLVGVIPLKVDFLGWFGIMGHFDWTNTAI